MPQPIPSKYLDDARTILRFLRDKFTADNEFNIKRWGHPLSETAGVSQADITAGLDITDRRMLAVCGYLLRLGLIRIVSAIDQPASYRQGVAGGGAGNFRPREVSTSYLDVRYRITDAGEVFLRESHEERMPAAERLRVYHGTTRELPVGPLKPGRRSHTFGPEAQDVGVFVSTDKDFAKAYAQGSTGRLYEAETPDDLHIFDVRHLVKDDHRFWPPVREDMTPEGQRFYDALAAGSIFPDANEDNVGDFLKSILRHDYSTIEDSQFTRWLRAEKYDAAWVWEGSGSERFANLLMLDPSKVTIVREAPHEERMPNTVTICTPCGLVEARRAGKARTERMPVSKIIQGVPQTVKFGDTTLGFVLMEAEGETYINLYSVRTPAAKRGKGAARAALAAFLAVMDAQKIPVALAASPMDKKTNRAKLVRFYESLGFRRTGRTINPAGDPMMERPVGGGAHEERLPVFDEDDEDSDVEYRDEGMVGRHWGSSGAGILFTTGKRVLVLLRSGEVNDPGVWSVPGGAVPIDEDGGRADPFETAMGESREEVGYPRRDLGPPVGTTVDSVVWKDPDSDFTFETFVVRVPHEFEPVLNWESDESRWVTYQDLDELDEEGALHPAFAAVLPDLAALAFDTAPGAVERLSTTWADADGEESPIPVTIEIKNHPSGFRVYAWAQPPTGEPLRVGNLRVRRIDDDRLVSDENASREPGEQDCTRDVEALRREYGRGAWDLYSVQESFVAPEHRGEGVGSAMYVAAVTEAGRRNGLLIAHACTENGETSKEARKAWRSRRFREVADVRGLVAAHRGKSGEKVDRMPWTAAEVGTIAVDMCLPDPVPGSPGPITMGVLARHSLLPVFNTDRDPPKNEYHWLDLDQITPALPLMHKLKVSEVARGHGGFLHTYRREEGERDDMAIGWWWRRHNFLKRHLAQVKSRGEALWDRHGDPTRRALALVAWAYHPEPKKWATWIRRQGGAVDRFPVRHPVHEERLAATRVTAPTLYHGTAFRNLPGILREGYHPGKGYSPHQTKTKTATFLTDDMQAAIGYSTAGDRDAPVAVLEFDVSGLTIEPDYDDAADLISVDLMQLQEALEPAGVDWQAALGEPIPEDDLSEVEEAVADLENQEERAAPFTLEIDTDPEGRSYLYAQPYVKMQIADGDEYAHDEFVLDAHELVWEDGVPYYQARQYLVRSGLPLSRLIAVWLEGEGGKHFTDYGSVEEDEDAGTRDFRKVSLVRLTPDEARARLASQ